MMRSEFDRWALAITDVRDPQNFTETQRLLALLDQVENAIDPRIGRVLFSLLTDGEDNGEKQRVVCLLSGYPVYEYYKALLEDLPRMIRECVENGWAYSAADYWGRNLNEGDLGDILRAYDEAPAAQQQSFLQIILSQDFFHEHDWPAWFMNLLRKREKNGI